MERQREGAALRSLSDVYWGRRQHSIVPVGVRRGVSFIFVNHL